MRSIHKRWLLLICLLPALSPSARSETPRHDAYGDPLPKGARFRIGTTRLRHDGLVSAVTWLPDGRTLASAGWDNTVRLWQIPGGKQLAKWDEMEHILLFPDGKSFACAGKDRTIRICDLATGKELRRLRVPGNTVFPYVFSPDGKVLAGMDDDQKIRLYETDTGKETHVFGRKASLGWHPLAFSPDGRTLVIATETSGLRCWDTTSGKKLKTLGSGWSTHVTFSPDGKMLAAVIDDEGAVACLWSWPSCKELRRINLKDFESAALAFSPDSKVLATGTDESIRLWDPATGKELRRFEGHRTSIHDLAFSPDGSLLAAAGEDGVVSVWEVHAKNNPRLLTGLGHRMQKVTLIGGRTLLTLGRDGALTLWDSRDGRRLRTVAEWHGEAMEFLASPDGSRALILPWFKQSPILWDLTTGRCLPALSGLFQPVTCAAFSPDGSMLAFADSDGFKTFIRLRETTAGRELRQLGEGKQAFSVSALAFSPDGRTLAAGYTDGSLTLWDLITNRPRHRVTGPQKKWVWPVTFSSDSRLLAAVWEGEYVIHLYETMSGQEIRVLRGQSTPIHALAFAADNRTLASSGPVPDSADKECLPPFTKLEAAIHLWDVLTGKQIHRLPGHQGRVHTLAFSSDGNTLVSGGGVEMVLSWDVAAVTHRRPDSKELPSAKLTDLWSALAARDAARAQRAVAELIQSPDTALTFLEKMLLPVPPVKLASIVALIADLDHADFARRERASRELEKIGEPAGPALRKLLKEKPSLEVRKRIEILLEAIDGRPTSPEGLRTFRALQVLETIGTPKAKQILEGLASGAAEAALTQEAKAALTRLSRRNANR